MEHVTVDEADSHSLRDQQPAVSLDCWLLFFATTVASRGGGLLNRRVRSLVMWEAFQQWRADRSIDITISHAMFGRLSRWHKGRVGGAVWYLDCKLAQGYAVYGPKALPRARLVAEGPQVTH